MDLADGVAYWLLIPVKLRPSKWWKKIWLKTELVAGDRYVGMGFIWNPDESGMTVA